MTDIKDKSKAPKNKKGTFFREGYWELYLILMPSLIVLFIFKYIPMSGLVIAFQDYNIFDGIFKSPFIGLAHFKRIFSNLDFYRVLWNTLFINFYKLFFWIPLPVIIALLLNEVKRRYFKRTVQTVIYLPHFLSWVIVGGIFANLLSVNGGIVNKIIMTLGFKPVRFMYDKSVFREVIVASAMWKEVGWGTIVYLGALTAVDPQMYEAAMIDGASKLEQIWYITIPSISNTIVLVLLMSLGNILNNSFEQIIVMYNPAVYDVIDIINTYVYRYGIGQMEYGYTTAIGLFNGLVGFILVMTTNAFSRKFLDRSLW